VSLGGLTPIQEFRKEATHAFLDMRARLAPAVEERIRRLLAADEPIERALDGLKGPSSTWTYLVSDEQFGGGIGLMQTANIGLAAGAALYVGPLLILTVLLERLRGRRLRD
jgi:preprotein translocase subunit SecA